MPIREMDWNAYSGQRARIYRNLNNGRMSIQIKVAGSWKVVGHVTDCILKDVKFHISESSRQRVIREHCKNVHAWGEGGLVGEVDESIHAPVDLAYDPYLNQAFVQRGTDISIAHCKFLVVRVNRVFVTLDAVDGSGNRPNLTVIAGTRSELVCPAQLSLEQKAIAA
jgi:hypothetical protein